MHAGRLFSPIRSLGKVSWEGRVEAESGRVQEVRQVLRDSISGHLEFLSALVK